MRRLVLPTLAIATSMMLLGVPLTSSAADYRSRDRAPTSESDTGPTASNYSDKMQTEQEIDPNTSGTLGMSPDWLRQRRIEFPDQVETGHPGMLTYRPDPWSSAFVSGSSRRFLTLISVRWRMPTKGSSP